MSMNTFSCIKPACRKQYETEEVEAYYCPSCVEKNKLIALELEKRISLRPKKRIKSGLDEYNSAPKINGFMVVKL